MMNSNTQTERADVLSLSIGGLVHKTWESYRIDSDLLTPADGWEVTFGSPGTGPLPAAVKKGATVALGVSRGQGGEASILLGAIDTIDDVTEKHGRRITLSGRDIGGRLMDCAAPILTMNKATLAQIIEKAVKPLGITKVVWQAKTAADLREKVHTEPGQTVWDWLKAACEANHVWPWFEPDGTLVIGQPDYSVPVLGSLVLDSEKTNVKSMALRESQIEAYQEVVVYGQAGGSGEEGHSNVRGVATWADGAVDGYVRRKVVVDGNCNSTALAKARAEKILADGRMAAYTVVVTVEGHRLGASFAKEHQDKLWAPRMRLELASPEKRIAGVFYLMKRVFKLSRNEGRTTELHFVMDGAWLLNMSHIKAKRRNDFHKRKGHYAAGGEA